MYHHIIMILCRLILIGEKINSFFFHSFFIDLTIFLDYVLVCYFCKYILSMNVTRIFLTDSLGIHVDLFKTHLFQFSVVFLPCWFKYFTKKVKNKQSVLPLYPENPVFSFYYVVECNYYLFVHSNVKFSTIII